MPLLTISCCGNVRLCCSAATSAVAASLAHDCVRLNTLCSTAGTPQSIQLATSSKPKRPGARMARTMNFTCAYMDTTRSIHFETQECRLSVHHFFSRIVHALDTYHWDATHMPGLHARSQQHWVVLEAGFSSFTTAHPCTTALTMGGANKVCNAYNACSAGDVHIA